MKYPNNIVKSHYSIKYCLFLIIVLNFLSYSLNNIVTGSFPYIKRLLNGNYIILSNTNISFADGALQTQFNVIHLDNIYWDENNNAAIVYIASTTVSQFKERDDGYIIAILNQEIFIFSSSGIRQTNTTISFIDPTNICSIIPNYKNGNNYYFTVINAQCQRLGTDTNCYNLLFHKGIFNFNSKEINFNDPIPFSFSTHLSTDVYATISCDIMIIDSEEKIVCLYGDYNSFATSTFDPNNYTELSYQTKSGGGQNFKSLKILFEFFYFNYYK